MPTPPASRSRPTARPRLMPLRDGGSLEVRWVADGIRVRRTGERRWHRIAWDQLLFAARAVEEPLFAPLHYADARALASEIDAEQEGPPPVDPRQVLMAFNGM